MANMQNLVQFSCSTREELREHARKAGIASGEARNKSKKFREAIEKAIEEQNEYGQYKINKMVEELIRTYFASSVFTSAYTKLQIFKTLRDTCGEKPKVEKE